MNNKDFKWQIGEEEIKETKEKNLMKQKKTEWELICKVFLEYEDNSSYEDDNEEADNLEDY